MDVKQSTDEGYVNELQDLYDRANYLEELLLDDRLTDVSAVEHELKTVRLAIDRYIKMVDERYDKE